MNQLTKFTNVPKATNKKTLGTSVMISPLSPLILMKKCATTDTPASQHAYG